MVEKNEPALIAAAKAGDETAFRDLLQPVGRELQAYAYRMLGGFHDAEDAVQEAQLKAWRSLGAYEPHASFRAWIYRIVTNTCLDMLRSRRRRVLPRDVGPSVPPGPPQTPMRTDIAWLEPYPDALLPETADPEARARLRQSIRLALVRAMQLLPPRQRAALILHEVLDFTADEVAAMLETTVAAIHSALQRARATVAKAGTEAPEDKKDEAIARFVQAWETGNFDRFVSLLTEDAILSMPPWVYWLDGPEAIVAAFTSPATWEGEPGPGRYRHLRTAMNGQPAALAYVRGPDGRYSAVCMTVLTVDGDSRVSELMEFVLPEAFAAWGYPATLG